MVFVVNTVVFVANTVVFVANTVVFVANTVVFWANTVILREEKRHFGQIQWYFGQIQWYPSFLNLLNTILAFVTVSNIALEMGVSEHCQKFIILFRTTISYHISRGAAIILATFP